MLSANCFLYRRLNEIIFYANPLSKSEPVKNLTLATAAKSHFVRIADIDVFSCEGPLCSLSFENERYRPQAYHLDCRAFLV